MTRPDVAAKRAREREAKRKVMARRSAQHIEAAALRERADQIWRKAASMQAEALSLYAKAAAMEVQP